MRGTVDIDVEPQARRGTNLPRMGDFNRSVVLDSIRRSRTGLSRVELGHSTGLSAQTVSNICRKLIDQQLVVEAGKASGAFSVLYAVPVILLYALVSRGMGASFTLSGAIKG